jgi:hypothetical protein
MLQPDLALAEVVCMGSLSALMLTVSRSYASHWYLSLIALVPMFRSVIRMGPIYAALTGATVGLLLEGASLVDSFTSTSAWYVSTALFSLFCFVSSVSVRRFGINPFSIPLIWLPIELCVGALNGVRFSIVGTGGNLMLTGVAAQLGLVGVSLLVLLLNSIVAYVVFDIISKRTRAASLTSDPRQESCLLHSPQLIQSQLDSTLLIRGPPLIPRW